MGLISGQVIWFGSFCWKEENLNAVLKNSWWRYRFHIRAWVCGFPPAFDKKQTWRHTWRVVTAYVKESFEEIQEHIRSYITKLRWAGLARVLTSGNGLTNGIHPSMWCGGRCCLGKQFKWKYTRVWLANVVVAKSRANMLVITHCLMQPSCWNLYDFAFWKERYWPFLLISCPLRWLCRATTAEKKTFLSLHKQGQSTQSVELYAN